MKHAFINIRLHSYLTLEFVRRIVYVRAIRIEIKDLYVAFVQPCRYCQVIEIRVQSRPTIARIANASPTSFSITTGDARENKTGCRTCNERVSSPKFGRTYRIHFVLLRTNIFKIDWINFDLLHSRFLSVKTEWNTQIHFAFYFRMELIAAACIKTYQLLALV